MNRFFGFRKTLSLAVVLLGLILLWSSSLTEGRIRGDAPYNVAMGFNLSRYGVISGSWNEPIEPTMYREPLPAVSTAIAVRVADAIMGAAEPDAYLSGPRAKLLKFQNLFWAGVMTVALLGLLLVLTNSFWLALLGAIIVNLPVPSLNRPHLDTLLTEPIASALLVAVAFMFAWWAHRRSNKILFLAGVTFGLLTLTKASFLYVFIGVLVLLPIVELWSQRLDTSRPGQGTFRRIGADMLVLAAAFLMVTLPWMWRNQTNFGDFAISERAGVVLMQRAVLNELTPEEYLGALYRFAPNKPLENLVAKITGFGPADLEQGGRLQRLNHGKVSGFAEDLSAERAGHPEKTITYHRRARAWRVKLANEYRAAGHPNPMAAADDELMRRASHLIKENLLQHIAFIPLAIWRGALVTTPILLLALLYGLRSRRVDISLAVLPSLGMIAIYALATPFETRMGVTVMPLATAMLWVPVARSFIKFRKWQALKLG